jgi:hypothetical protein
MQRALAELQFVPVVQDFSFVIGSVFPPPAEEASQVGELMLSSLPRATQPKPDIGPLSALPAAKVTVSPPPLGVDEEPVLPPPLVPPPPLPAAPLLSLLLAQETATKAKIPLSRSEVVEYLFLTIVLFMSPSRFLVCGYKTTEVVEMGTDITSFLGCHAQRAEPREPQPPRRAQGGRDAFEKMSVAVRPEHSRPVRRD